MAILGSLGTNTWHKHYCMYTKENKILTMIPYTQTQGRLVGVSWSSSRNVAVGF